MALTVVAAFGKTGALFQDFVSLDLNLGAAGTYACYMLVSSLSSPTPSAGKVDGVALSSSQAQFSSGATARLYYGEFTTADGTITLRGEVSDNGDSAKMLGIIVSGYDAALIESYETHSDPVWDTTQTGPTALVSATGDIVVGLLLDVNTGTLTTVGGSGGTDWGPTPADTGNSISDGTNKFVLTWPGAATVSTNNGTWAANMQPLGVFFNIPSGATLPTITGGPTAPSVPENTTTIGTYTASEAGTWGVSGADADKVSISAGGVLSFLVGRNFDAPGPFSAAGTNAYSVSVTFTATSSGLAATPLQVVASVTNVNEAPTVTTHPSNVSVSAGATANFSAAFAGDLPITVIWQVFAGSAWSNLAGQTALSLSLPNVQVSDSGKQYRCRGANAFGGPIDTNAATLTVSAALVPPSFTTQPTNQTVNVGGSMVLTAAATGTPTPTLQWQRFISSVWTDISGATAATYTLANAQLSDNGAQFRCVATNAAGSSDSSTATLTVLPGGAGTYTATTKRMKVNGSDLASTGVFYSVTSGRNGALAVEANKTGTTNSDGSLTATHTAPGWHWVQVSTRPGPGVNDDTWFVHYVNFQ